MIETFKIATNLSITGDANKKMIEFLNSVTKASKATQSLGNALKTVSKAFEMLNSGISAANPQLTKLLGAFARMNSEMLRTNRSFDYFNQGVMIADGNVNRMKSHTDMLRNSLRSLASAGHQARTSIAGVGKGGGGGGGAGGGIGGSTTNAVLGGAAARFGLFSPAAMSGFGAAGTAIHGFSEQSTFERAGAQLASQGFNKGQVSQMIRFAQSQNLRGISGNDMLAAVVDAAMATSNAQSAMMLSPTLAKISFANRVNQREGFDLHQEQNLIRFAELRAGSDPRKIAQQMELAQQVYSASGGRVKPSELLNFQKMATTAGYNLSDVGLLKLLPIIQELGGFRTGTGYNTLFNNLIKGGSNTSAAVEGQRIGLFDKGKIQFDPIGRKLKVGKGGPLKKEYADLLQTDLVGFVERVLNPLYAKSGITSENDIIKENALLFTQTAAREISVIQKNMEKINNSVLLHQNAFATGSSYAQALNIQPGKLLALTAAFDDFSRALGRLTGPAIQAAMTYLTDWFESVAWLLNKISDLAGVKTSPMDLGLSTRQPMSLTIPINIGQKRIADIVLDAFNMGHNTLVNNGMSGANTPNVGSSNTVPQSSGSFSP